jgi:uncharacterized protein (TIGR02466 family)
MNVERKVQNLFPTPVTIVNIQGVDFKKYANLVLDSITQEQQLHLENYGIANTSDTLHKTPDFFDLYELINNETMMFFNDVLGLAPDDAYMSNMWSTVQTDRANHHTHQHPNSFYSGVIYLDIPEGPNIDPGWITFIDPRQAKNMSQPDYKKHNMLSDRSYGFKPQTGMLLLFPSWLEHGTQTCRINPTDRRISLSFNYALTKASGFTMKLNVTPNATPV